MGMDSRNIADVLEAGYFPTSRAKHRTADDSGASSSDEDSTRRFKIRVPERDSYEHDASASASTTDSVPPLPRTGPSSNSSSTLSMPEYSASELIPSRRQTFKDFSTAFVRIRGYPPSPSVEDEVESLAREQHGALAAQDDPIPNKGDPEQFPILMEAHEHNPERRFVLVTPNDEVESARPSLTKPSSDAKETYDAKTRKHDPSPSATAAAAAATSAAVAAAALAGSGSSTSSRPPPSSSSMLNERGEPLKRTRVRSQSSAHVDQQSRSDAGSKRVPPTVDTSHPDVVKQSAGGRDKAYYDYSRPPNSASPTTLRTPTTCDPRARSTYGNDRVRSDDGNLLSPQGPPGSDHRRSRSTADGSRIERVDEVPPSGYSEPGRPPSRTNSLYMRSGRSREPRRCSPPRDEEPSSDEGKTLRAPAMLLRKPTTDIREGEDEFVNPDDIVPPMPTPRSRGRTPTIPSGRVPYEELGANPRHSMPILPVSEQDRARREDLPYPTEDDSPRNGRSPAPPVMPTRTRSRSRAPTMRVSTASIPVPVVVPAPSSPNSAVDPRRSTQFTSSGDPRSPTMGSSLEGANQGYWQPDAFDPDQNKLTVERPPGVYRRYSEDMSQTRLPECRRKKPIAGKKDWMTLEQCTDFNICPTCYGGLFSQSAFSDEFVPAARPLDIPIACDFGSVPWYRIAWLLILKNRRSDLMTFHRITTTVKNAILRSETCPGDRTATRSWYSIAYPKDGQLIPNFDICYTCASSIEILLPQLKNIFTPVAPASEPTRSLCAMRFSEDRKRFVQYFDVMETIADRAALNNRGGAFVSQDLTQLATTLDRMSSFVECHEDTPIIDGGWREMREMPDVTVCGDCFDEVVRPQVEQDNAVALKFYMKAQRRAAPTTCQLYSDRMRDVFRKACRKSDLAYLGSRVSERCEVEQSIRGKLDRLRREADIERQRGRDRDAKRLEEKIDHLIKEWRKWE